MTDASRPDVAAILADVLAVAARYDRAGPWPADPDDINERLAALAQAVGVTVAPYPRQGWLAYGHWSRADRETAIAAIADELPAGEAETLRSLGGR